MNKLVDKNDVFKDWKAAEGKELNTMILSSIVNFKSLPSKLSRQN